MDDHQGVVDVYVHRLDGSELFVDITTVKPNLKEFHVLKRKLLRWAALRMSTDISANIDTKIGIPYNPYYPEPYARWTGSICDPIGDLLVQDDLWSAFAGDDVFQEILLIFQDVGREIKKEVNDLISQTKR